MEAKLLVSLTALYTGVVSPCESVTIHNCKSFPCASKVLYLQALNKASVFCSFRKTTLLPVIFSFNFSIFSLKFDDSSSIVSDFML